MKTTEARDERGPFPDLKTVREIDFQRLEDLVVERIRMLALTAKGMAITGTPSALNDAICRDLILPNVSLLVNFIEAISMSMDEAEADDHAAE